MSGRAITLTLPENLYARLAQRAADSRRSVADEAIEAMAMSLPTLDELPAEIARDLGSLDNQDDQQLLAAARRILPTRAARRLRALSRAQGQRSLSAEEADELLVLLDRLEDIGLLRAKAVALLRERGHDVGALLPRG